MAALIRGKVDIHGGYIYGTEYCDLIIGHTNKCPNENDNRVKQLFAKSVDIVGNINIKDSNKVSKLEIDNDKFKLYGNIHADQITLNKIEVNESLQVKSLLQINQNVCITLDNCQNFFISRNNSSNNSNFMCHINNSNNNSLLVSGNLNIENGTLYINDCSLDNIIDKKLNCQTIIKLKNSNNSGLLLESNTNKYRGLLFIDTKFKFVKNYDCSDQLNEYNLDNLELDDLSANNINTNTITSGISNLDLIINKNIEKVVNIINVQNNGVQNIDTTNYSVTLFKNNNNITTDNLIYKLICPTISNNSNNAIIHTLILDKTFSSSIIIEGSIIFPDGTDNSCAKIKLKKKGQNITLLFIIDKWYIISGGAELIT